MWKLWRFRSACSLSGFVNRYAQKILSSRANDNRFEEELISLMVNLDFNGTRVPADQGLKLQGSNISFTILRLSHKRTRRLSFLVPGFQFLWEGLKKLWMH